MKRTLITLLVLALVLAFGSACAEGSLLQPVYDGISAASGAHLNYNVRRDSFSLDSVYDAHAKSGSYCCIKTTDAYGVTVRSGTCFVDGSAYTLKPDDMQAILAISTSSSIIKNNVLLLDDLYKLIAGHIGRTDFTVETREVDGVSYTVEVYPGGGYVAGVAFYFDESGHLAYVLESAPEEMPSLGEAFYTVHVIDDAVDESLFDLSAYEIVTL